MAIKLGGGGGGISVPIGGTLDLLDVTDTVTKGSEVFLRTGLTAPSSTYPNAPVKSFLTSGTLASQTQYSQAISPWQGFSTVYHTNGGGMADTGTQEVFVVTTSGYVNKFSSYGATFVGSRNLLDGTVFPTTATASYLSCVAHEDDARAEATNPPSSTMRAFFSGNGGTGGAPAIAYLSNDLQTHHGTFNLATDTNSAFPSNRDYIKAIFVNGELIVIHSGPTTTTSTYQARYILPNFNNGSSGTLTFNVGKRLAIMQTNAEFWRLPEVMPDVLTPSTPRFFIRGHSSGSTSRLEAYDYRYNGVQTTFSYDVSAIGQYGTSYYRAPYAHHTSGLQFIRTGVSSAGSVFSAKYTNVTQNIIFFASAYSATGYTGYAFKDANTIYIGHSVAEKAFAIHPTTRVLGTPIDLSSQAAPYRFAHHNNVLYNLNGTNIHTYSTSSNAFVSTIDISNKVSGTNAVGIAHDGTNLYVLDGSNSKIHKYNSTGSSYVSFVTLSDTPHTSSTLVSLAVDATNNVFLVTDTSNCHMYALDGTTKTASTSSNSWQDADVHNGHVVGMQTNSVTTTRIPTVDVVGNPAGSLGSVTTTYYRVG